VIEQQVAVYDDINGAALIYGRARDSVLSGGRPHTALVKAKGDVPGLDDLTPEGFGVQASHWEEDELTVWLTQGDAVSAVLQISEGLLEVNVLGVDHDYVRKLSEEIAGKVTPPETAEDIVPYQIWNYAPTRGPVSTYKKISCDPWGDIRQNYVPEVASRLDEMMKVNAPRGGKLILWNGPVGTGKTSAIRSMSREWSQWCKPHYITDPERLFAEPSYLLHLAAQDDRPQYLDLDDEVRPRKAKWRLLIAEDSDEFLRADAREQSGAALGRLLNFADGILGQGSNTLILLTTNEELGSLHPAVARPGRCLAQLEFQRFTAGQASEWLGAKASGAMTLAEMYEERMKLKISTAEKEDWQARQVKS